MTWNNVIFHVLFYMISTSDYLWPSWKTLTSTLIITGRSETAGVSWRFQLNTNVKR
ncbi:hypothetical protein KC19_VG097200 [Ceratodon purpureus]|uniref:Uncharacterized protein n=1 Tax=Ceratodon purpureus TaxID=3225 RepID=A0A8T0HNG6_CERPU|nr:hypothetical protein KC19_VG097200 [Ceratodon purpureus]